MTLTVTSKRELSCLQCTWCKDIQARAK